MINKQENFLERFFKVREKGSTMQTEILAGLTTFVTMAYILAVNPDILGNAGMDTGSVFTATALSAAIATLVMAIFANLPIGLAPGMGLNAFFAFTVVLEMGYSWQFALTAVFLEGLLFILLTVTNIREAILQCIPIDLKRGIAAGIGLFIAFIGLQNAGIVIDNPATLVSSGALNSPTSLVVLIGFFSIGIMLHYKVKGALLYGIFIATFAGIPLGVTDINSFDASKLFSIASVEPTFLQFDFNQILTVDMAIVLVTFLFIDLFDTVGILAGLGSKANLLDEKGQLINSKQAFMADAIGTTVGAALGTSTVTSYVESSAGVAVGGKTGLTAAVIASLFFISLFFSPIFLMIPKYATAPVLIIVGLFMFSEVAEVDFNDYVVSLPVFVTFLGMPLTYSIAHGIAWGVITFVILAIASKRVKEVHPVLAVLALLFIIKFATQ